MTHTDPIQPAKNNTSTENGIVEVSGSTPLCSTRIYKASSATEEIWAAIQGSKLEVWIPGLPATAGSKKFVGHAKSTGRAILIDTSGAKGRNWRNMVAWTVQQAMEAKDFPPFPQGTPVIAAAHFVLPRPQAHKRANGTLKDSAPYWNTKKPDLTKMWRSAEDALKGILWHDDGQVCSFQHHKTYGDQPGLHLTVWEAIHPMTEK